MKSEGIEHTYKEDNLFNQLVTDSAETIITCSQNNEARDFCCNQLCLNNPVFVCCVKNCTCQIEHFACLKGNIQYAKNIINSKLQSVDEIKLHYQKVIDKMIDELSDLRDKLLLDVEDIVRYGKMNKIEKKFLDIMENKFDANQIKGEQTAILWYKLNKNLNSKENCFQLQIEALKKFEESSKINIAKVQKDIQSIRKKYAFYSKSVEVQIQLDLVHSSVICNTPELAGRLIQMFPKKIKSIQLLFRASINNFSIQQYYKVCGSIQNTIVLALTSQEKGFGGYTPFRFYSGKDEWVVDKNRQSFLFSLSENQKFNLIHEHNYCICRYSSQNKLIQFGGDFYIRDNANTVKNNTVGNPSYYASNSKFKQDKETYLKLNGGEGPFCSLKQWEVFKVEFK